MQHPCHEGFSNTRKIFIFPGDVSNGEASRSRPRRLDSVPDKAKRLHSEERSERTLASHFRFKQRTTASSGAVCANTCMSTSKNT